MAITTPDVARAAELFHALSDATRLEILERLRADECCVCDLTDAMDAAQSRLSFHLKVLKDAGLVTDRREGRWMYYSMNTNTPGGGGGVGGALAAPPSSAGRRAACCLGTCSFPGPLTC